MTRTIGPFQRGLSRIANTLRHRLLTLTPLRHARASARRRRLEHFAARSLPPAFAPLVDGGVQIVPAHALDRLGIDRDTVARLAASIAGDPAWAGGATRFDSDDTVAAFPDAYRLGLDPAVLAFAEAYLGQPCFYGGALVKREVADGAAVASRQWHLDIEDERMLRILVYLSPVLSGDGPFEYVAAPQSLAAKASSGYVSGYLREADMRAIVPDGDWTEALATAGDVVLFDGTRVFHRAQPPRRADRYSLTLTYVSRRSLQLRLTSRLSARCQAGVVAGVTADVAACLPPPRR